MLRRIFSFWAFPFRVGLSVASPRLAAGFTLQSLTLYVQMHEAPGKLPRRRLQFVILRIYPDTPEPLPVWLLSE